MTKTRPAVGFAILVALGIIAPWVAYPVFLMKGLCFALFACAFNLLLGYAGLMSFGHAMYFGMAGYFFGHVVKVWNMPPELGLLAGVAGAAVLGLVTGALAIRRQGIYFAMITLALGSPLVIRKIDEPPMPSSGFSTMSSCSARKSRNTPLRRATSVGGQTSANHAVKSFSLASRRLRGSFTTSVPRMASSQNRPIIAATLEAASATRFLILRRSYRVMP